MQNNTVEATNFKGNDRILIGFVLGLLTFWLFSMTLLNINAEMNKELGMEVSAMNLAVSITSLFSGLFVVVFGGLADRFGRVKITNLGFILAIAGALLVAVTPAKSAWTLPVLLSGRVLQGLSGACIMPATMSLLRAYWDDAGRQRAISIWSMGTWGGTSFSSLFGGYAIGVIGWRGIFIVSIIVAVIGMLLIRGIPESKAETKGRNAKFDIGGVITFMIAIVALQVALLQVSNWGWTDPKTIGLFALAVIFGVVFFLIERKHDHPFVDLTLFKNSTYTGATVANFLINSLTGVITVTLILVQLAGGLTPAEAGLMTVGYGIVVILFIRVGEKLLRHYGPRKPMLWACWILLASVLLMTPTYLMTGTYIILVSAAFVLFGLGLAFFATPSTDAALSNLPLDQTGAGSGIYKMASTLGASFGLAISTAIFTGVRLRAEPISALDNVIEFVGRQDNVQIRQAALLALLFNVVIIIVAMLVIRRTIPKASSK